MSEYLRNLKINLFQMKLNSAVERKYFANNMITTLTTLTYTIVFLIFSNILFNRFPTLGVMDKDNALLSFAISQAFWFLALNIYMLAARLLNESVMNGNFDFHLLRPLNIRWFTNVQRVSPILLIKQSLLPISLTLSQVDFSNITINASAIIRLLILFVCGMVVTRTLCIFLALPAFRGGDSTMLLLALNENVGSGPSATASYQDYNPFLKFVSFSIMPGFLGIHAAYYVSFIDQSWILVIMGILAAITSTFLYRLLWRIAIRSYSSASS
jgi:ABC-2 type transport system permease protein